jgi:hypothetical protein
MFDKPNAFEYLLFDLENWNTLSKIEKVRASLYFLKEKGNFPPRDWETVSLTVQQFENFLSEGKIVRIR